METAPDLLDYIMRHIERGAKLGCRHEVAKVVADALFLRVSLHDLKVAMDSAGLDRRDERT